MRAAFAESAAPAGLAAETFSSSCGADGPAAVVAPAVADAPGLAEF